MSELALKLIAENKAAHKRGDESCKRLDIGNCGLTELPEELFDCVWLEELMVSNEYWKREPEDMGAGSWVTSVNTGEKNDISLIPDAIEKLENLRILVLEGEPGFPWRITNIPPVTGLGKLEVLYMGHNSLGNITPLSGLRNLKYLYLSFNKITSSGRLLGLNQLETLVLSHNRIGSTLLLSRLPKLKSLDLNFGQVSDISSLDEFSELTFLDLGSNNISDISILRRQTSLKTLFLSNNQVKDYSTLSELNNLTSIRLSHNNLEEIKFLSSLTNLTSLFLSDNEIFDIAPLASMKGLQNLSLRKNRISDISSLKTLKDLQILDLGKNQISEINPVSALKGLEILDLSENSVARIDALADLHNLQTLNLYSNQITQVDSLAKVIMLKSLNLGSNKIAKIDAFLPCSETLLLKEDFYIDISDNPLIIDLRLQSQKNKNYREDILNALSKFSKSERFSTPSTKKIKITQEKVSKKDITLPAKVLLLGNHASGKSSLLHFIQNSKLAENSKSTHVIRIEKYFGELKTSNTFPDAIFFDFGGQDYYHGIYKAFISPGSLQVLLWNKDSDFNQTRLDSNGLLTRHYTLSYWLGQKLHMEGGSNTDKPTQDQLGGQMFVVQTYADKDEWVPKIDPGRAQDYKIIDDCFLSLSAAAEKKIESRFPKLTLEKLRSARLSFYSAICEAIEKNKKVIQAPVWYADFLEDILKSSAKKTDCNPVSLDELRAKYGEQAIPTFSWETEFEQLHNQGLVLYYRNEIPNMVWLNPQAMAEHIHAKILVQKTIVKRKGIVPKAEFNFNKDIIRLLTAQNIIFFHQETDEYIIPNYLPLASDDQDFELLSFGISTHVFTLKFEQFIPFGLINQMVCFFGILNSSKRFWRDQLLFTFNKKKILIQLNFDALEVRVTSSDKLTLLETRYFYYSVLAVYWNEIPLDFEKFGKILGSNPGLSESEANKLGHLHDDEKTMDKVEAARVQHRKEILTLQRVFQKRPPMDLYAAVNDKDFISVSTFHDTLESQPDVSNIISFPILTNLPTPDVARPLVKNLGRPIAISLFQPFSLRKLFMIKKVFISYSHDDIEHRSQVQKFLINLERDKLIELWHDGFLDAGDQWDDKILGKLREADIVILLVSQSFINSTYIFEKEMKIALENGQEKNTKIIPVLLKNCDWQNWNVLDKSVREDIKIQQKDDNKDTTEKSREIRNYQFLPRNEMQRLTPVNKFSDVDDAWMQLTDSIRKIVGI